MNFNTAKLLFLAFSIFYNVSAFSEDKASVGMSGVDDVGKVFIANKKGVRQVTTCTWSANPGCSASEDITYALRKGENLILFVLWNDVFTGCPAFIP